MKPTCGRRRPVVQALACGRRSPRRAWRSSGAASSSMPSAVASTQPGRSTTSASSTGRPCPRPVVSRTTSSARAENVAQVGHHVGGLRGGDRGTGGREPLSGPDRGRPVDRGRAHVCSQLDQRTARATAVGAGSAGGRDQAMQPHPRRPAANASRAGRVPGADPVGDEGEDQDPAVDVRHVPGQRVGDLERPGLGPHPTGAGLGSGVLEPVGQAAGHPGDRQPGEQVAQRRRCRP